MKRLVKFTKKGYLKGRVPKRLVGLTEKKYSRKSQIRVYKLYLIIYNHWLKETKRRKRNNKALSKVYYVPIAVNYFRKVISTRYGDDLKFLKDNGFVGVETIERDPFELYHYRRTMAKDSDDIDKIKIKQPLNILDGGVKIETYSVGKRPKAYCILEQPLVSDTVVKIEMKFKPQEFRLKNERFLRAIGENPKIFQDNYSYRLYHNLSTTYKEELPYIGEFVYYDVKSSIPHHIKKLLIEEGYDNAPFLRLFDGDFYTNFQNVMGFDDLSRDKVKKKFATLIYAKKHRRSKSEMARIKSELPIFHKKLKRNFGRDVSILETKFMLNTVVNFIPIDEVLTIHDGFIVFPEDENKIDEYLDFISKKTEGFYFVKSRMKKVEIQSYFTVSAVIERLKQFELKIDNRVVKPNIETYLDDIPN